MTKEEAKETVRRIFNFCEEIDNSLPDNEKTGYRMVHDVFTLLRYIDDVAEVKHGEWIENSTGTSHKCSVCGCPVFYVFDSDYCECLSSFCPHCGADMRGENKWI